VALLLVGVIGYAAIAPSDHRSTASRPVPEGGAARAPATSASGVPAFSSGADVRAYAASQAAIVQGARSFKGQDAVTETNNFIAGLGAGATQQAAGADTFGAQAPKAAAPQAPTSTLPVGGLAGCLETVLGAAPTTMVPLQAVAVTYQGTPAWLLVFAASGPAGAPNQVHTWVQSQASCSTLDQSSFTP